jgi:2-dehydro-3-deoxyphosphooctonate aldolase (KDO 8-P synthase)
MPKIIETNGVQFANHLPFTLIAGPCQLESREHSLEMADAIFKITQKLEIGFVFKSSFDKANRSSGKSQRGIGLKKALPIFTEIKEKYNCPILTDIHSEEQARLVGASDAVDILQIPAFLCRQTDILKAAAQTGKIVNVKKGQFLAPWDMQQVVAKIEYFGSEKIMLTERGASFGYNALVSDMRSLPIMAQTGYPVIFDATHSVQQPGGLGEASGGQREFVEVLARAAIAVGVAGIFAEVHQDPDNAPSDGPCMLRLNDLEQILTTLKALDQIVKQGL